MSKYRDLYRITNSNINQNYQKLYKKNNKVFRRTSGFCTNYFKIGRKYGSLGKKPFRKYKWKMIDVNIYIYIYNSQLSNLNKIIKVVDRKELKMESFQEILQCSVCYTQFNYSTHEPYVLFCGHNICKQAIKKLF